MNVALLTAAGSGTRMQLNIPKQFIHVDDKPVIIYTMEAFQNHPSIDAIIVVTIDAWSNVLWAYAKQFGITKLKWVVPGGDSGQESIRKGLEVLKQELSDEDVVLVHDGNRPLVSSQIISDSLATFSKYGSAVAAIDFLKKHGCRNITMMNVIGCPEGVKAVQEAHPDVELYLAALDERLNEHAYIIPGLGDAGDRIFGTK